MRRTLARTTLTVFVFMLFSVSCRWVSKPAASDTLIPLPIDANTPTPSLIETLTPRYADTITSGASWQDQVIYVLIPHKFYDGDPTNNYMLDEYQLPNLAYQGGFLGGDIAGIRQQMGYLKGLGVTTVLLYPILSNDEKPFFEFLATGYRVRDYQSIDHNFGANADFTQLIQEFHATTNGARMNVILDLPVGTTGQEHPWIKNSSYYRPWDYQTITDNIGCRSGSCEPYVMPDGAAVDHSFGMLILNHTEPGVYAEVRDEIIFWLVDNFDIDGFRYDSAHNFDSAFWPKLLSDFRQRYGATKPDFWHIAEVFIEPGQEKSWQVSLPHFVNQTVSNDVRPMMMDGLYDFALLSFIQNVFAKGQDPRCIPRFCTNLLKYLVRAESIDHPARLLAPLDNYESPTFLQAVTHGNATAKLYLASVFLLTINRVPLIYSGNEYGIDYTTPGTLFAGSLDQNYHAKFKKLIQIRRDHVAFRQGRLTGFVTPSSILAYARQQAGQTFIVVLNNAAASQTLGIELGLQEIACLGVKNLLVEHDQNIQLKNLGNNSSSLSVTLDAWEPKIIQCE